MLLIVGDTWCAVTDPLRYHSRISELKAWIMITLTWSLSIAFGIASAFRQDLYSTQNEFSHEDKTTFDEVGDATQLRHNDSAQLTQSASQLMMNEMRRPSGMDTAASSGPLGEFYDTAFACVYFVLIILLPICLVCGMYWKIFTEAKQNGLRMRQNGSSPLLQSALNLAAASAASSTASASSRDSAASNTSRESQLLLPSSGGLTMNIDRRLNEPTARPILTPVHNRKYLEIPNTSVKVHNYLLPPPNSSRCAIANERSAMTRNLSARHLLLCEQNESQMRHVRSTPNLHKTLPQPDVIPNHSTQQHHHCITVHVPIKALSYMTSIRHRLSNASSIFKYREESRAARISILVVIMFMVSYLPYGMLVLLEGRHITFVPNAKLLAVLFVMISNISSPFIFAYRNKRVRRGVCRLFGMDAKTNERLQKRRFATRHSKANRNSSSSAFVHRSHSRASINSIKYLSPHHCQKSGMVGGGSFILDPNQHTQQTAFAAQPQQASHNVEDMKHKMSLLQRFYNTSRRLSCTSSACSSTCSDSSRESSDV